MTRRPRIACLAAALLTAGGVAAQPVPGTLADAALAAERLVETAHARDWPALVAFMDPQIPVEFAADFPDSVEELEQDARALLAEQHIDADSLFERLRPPGQAVPGGIERELPGLVRLLGWMSTLYANGPPDEQALMARVMSIAMGCAPASPLTLFDDVRYVPVRADVRTDGTVEAIGILSATVQGEVLDGIAVTPLRWADGRWTVDRAATEAADAQLNPAAAYLSSDALNWLYILVSTFQENPDGAAGGCGNAGE